MNLAPLARVGRIGSLSCALQRASGGHVRTLSQLSESAKQDDKAPPGREYAKSGRIVDRKRRPRPAGAPTERGINRVQNVGNFVNNSPFAGKEAGSVIRIEGETIHSPKRGASPTPLLYVKSLIKAVAEGNVQAIREFILKAQGRRNASDEQQGYIALIQAKGQREGWRAVYEAYKTMPQRFQTDQSCLAELARWSSHDSKAWSNQERDSILRDLENKEVPMTINFLQILLRQTPTDSLRSVVASLHRLSTGDSHWKAACWTSIDAIIDRSSGVLDDLKWVCDTIIQGRSSRDQEACYAHALAALRRRNRTQTAQELYQYMQGQGIAFHTPFGYAQAAHSGRDSAEKRESARKGLRQLQQMKGGNDFQRIEKVTFYALAHFFLNDSDPDGVFELHKLMKIRQLNFSQTVGGTCFQYASNMKDASKVMSYLSFVASTDDSCRTVAFRTALNHVKAFADVDCAWKIFSMAEEHAVHLLTKQYRLLIDFFADCGQLEKAEAVFEAALRKDERGHAPYFGTYLSMIRAYSRANQPSKALELYHKARQAGLEIDMRALTTVLSGFVQQDSVEGVLQLAAEIALTESTPDSAVLCALLTFFSRKGKWQEAASVIEQAERLVAAPDIRLMTAMIDAYRRMGKPSAAEGVFRRMVELGLQPDEGAHRAILTSYAAAGRTKEVESHLESMAGQGFPMSKEMYEAAILAYGRAGDAEKAEQTFVRVTADPNVPVTTKMANLALTACFSGKKPGDWNRFERIAQYISDNNIDKDVSTCNGLARGYLAADRLGEVARVWEELEELQLEPDVYTFNWQAQYLKRDGSSPEKLEQLLTEKYKRFPESRSYVGDGFMHEALLTMYINQGKLQDALRVVGGVMSQGVSVTKGFVEQLMRGIVTDPEDAFRLLRRLEEVLKEEELREFRAWPIHCMVNAGRYDEAIRSFEAALETNPPDQINSSLALAGIKAYLAMGAHEKAGQAVQHLSARLKKVDEVEGQQLTMQERNDLLTALCGAYADGHNLRGLNSTLEVSETMDTKLYARTKGEIIRALTQHGYLHRAAQKAQDHARMQSPNAEWIEDIADCAARLGDVKILDEMVEKRFQCGGPQSARILTSVADLLFQGGMNEQAAVLIDAAGKQSMNTSRMTFNQILKVCSENNAYEQMLNALGLAMECQAPLSGQTYAVLKNCHSGKDQMQLAEHWLQRLKESAYGRSPAIWHQIIEDSLAEGRLGNALDEFEQMKELGVRALPQTFGSLLRACSEGGLGIKGDTLTNELQEQTYPTEVLYRTLVQGYGASNAEEAKSLWIEMRKKGFRLDLVTASNLVSIASHRADSQFLEHILTDTDDALGAKGPAVKRSLLSMLQHSKQEESTWLMKTSQLSDMVLSARELGCLLKCKDAESLRVLQTYIDRLDHTPIISPDGLHLLQSHYESKQQPWATLERLHQVREKAMEIFERLNR